MNVHKINFKSTEGGNKRQSIFFKIDEVFLCFLLQGESLTFSVSFVFALMTECIKYYVNVWFNFDIDLVCVNHLFRYTIHFIHKYTSVGLPFFHIHYTYFRFFIIFPCSYIVHVSTIQCQRTGKCIIEQICTCFVYFMYVNILVAVKFKKKVYSRGFEMG